MPLQGGLEDFSTKIFGQNHYIFVKNVETQRQALFGIYAEKERRENNA